MTDTKKSGLEEQDFFEVEIEVLRIDTTVTFDSYVYLPKNERYLLCLRASTQITPGKQEQIRKMGHRKIFVLKSQKEQFEAYTQTTLTGGEETPPETVTVTGGASEEVETRSFSRDREAPSEVTRLKAEKVEEGDDIRVFKGTPTVNQDKTVMKVKSLASKEEKADRKKPVVFGYSAEEKSVGKVKAEAKGSEEVIRVKSAGTPKMKVDAEFLNTFIVHTQGVFQQVCRTSIQFKAPSRRTAGGSAGMQIAVASFVGLVSQTIRGTIGLCFPEKTYLYLLSHLTGVQVTEITPDTVAGSGELLNTIFERARPQLIEQGYLLERAVPTMASGKNLSLPHLIPDAGFSIIFDSAGGPFQFEVGIKTGS